MSSQHLTTSGAGARHLFFGLLLGLGPLMMATEGVLSWGQFGEVGVALFFTLMVAGLALTGIDALALLPLLIIPTTRRIGMGVAVGLAITCAVAAYLSTHGFWNGMFD